MTPRNARAALMARRWVVGVKDMEGAVAEAMVGVLGIAEVRVGSSTRFVEALVGE